MNTFYTREWARYNNKNITIAKWKLGNVVNFVHPNGIGYGKIIGIGNTGDGVEYALEGVHLLLWEPEIIGIYRGDTNAANYIPV